MTTGTFVFEWAVPESEPGKEKEGNSASATAHAPPLVGHAPLTAYETELFVPALLTQGRKLVVRGLGPDDRYVHDQRRQTLFVVPRTNAPGTRHRIEVSLNPPLEPAFELNDVWSDFGARIMSLLVVIIGIIIYYFLPDHAASGVFV